MQSAKENFLELIKKDGRPDRLLRQYEALYLMLNDPVNFYLMKDNFGKTDYFDRWGVNFITPPGSPGRVPHITEENKVIKDITHWRDYVHAPEIEANCTEGWEECRKQNREACPEDKLLTCFMGTGLFEQSHFLMGFEDCLTNFYEHPDEMHELIDYILEYRLKFVKLLIEGIRPDAILTHDDWGTSNALFMKEDMWREFFKEPYRKFYGYIRSQGVVAIHHGDSFCAPIVKDMAEIGIQVWQGTLPENNIPKLIRELDGDMVLMGGVGAAIDRAESTEEETKAYVKELLDECGNLGHFIPCITYGLPGAVFKHIDPFIDAAIDDYNAILHAPSFRPEIRKKVVGGSVTYNANGADATNASPENTSDNNADSIKATGAEEILSNLSAALMRGQKKKVITLCEQGLEMGLGAKELLSGGLVDGMTKLGDDFSAGKAFVPEMLMAARCMQAATEILKPYLTSLSSDEESKPTGRVCIGTVKGDLHDIGKNLVKIMMEGSGLEVIDLGVDVTAETFVSTAINEHCDIICCSSLLTTCMEEMRRVVELTKQEGIRDKVKIMIGGAPISQAYCDEIHADAYTDDAGAAAKKALQLLGA